MGEDASGVASLFDSNAVPLFATRSVARRRTKRTARRAPEYGILFRKIQRNQAEYLLDRLGGNILKERRSSRTINYRVKGTGTARLYNIVRPMLKNERTVTAFDAWLEAISAGRNRADKKMRRAMLQLRELRRGEVAFPSVWLKSWANLKDV